MAMVLPPGGGMSGLPPIGAQAVLLGLQQFNTSTRIVNQQLNSINQTTVRMAETTRVSIDNSIRNYNRYSNSVRDTSRGIGVAAVALGTVLGNVLMNIVELGAEAASTMATAGVRFEKALKPIEVFGRASTGQMKDLGDSILETTRIFNVNANAVAAADASLVKAGLSFQQVKDGAQAATIALTVASDGELEFARSSELISQAMFAFKDQMLTANDAANAIAGTFQNSTATAQDLYLAFKQIVPLAAILKIPITEIGAALALLNQEGIRGETAGTSLRNVFLRLLTPTKDVTDVMTRYNISLFNTKGQFIGLLPFFEQLNAAFGDQVVASGKMTEEQRDVALASIGMSRSLLAALAIVKQGPQEFNRFHDAIKAFDVQDVLRQFTDTTIAQLGIIGNQLVALGIKFTEGLVNDTKRGTQAVNELLRTITLKDAEAAGEQARKTIGAFFELLDQRMPAIQTFIGGVGTLWDGISKAIGGGNTLMNALAIEVNNVARAADVVLRVLGTLAAAGGQAMEGVNKSAAQTSEQMNLTGEDVTNATNTIIRNLGQFIATVLTVGKTVQYTAREIARYFNISTDSIATGIEASSKNVDMWGGSWATTGNQLAGSQGIFSKIYEANKTMTVGMADAMADFIRYEAKWLRDLIGIADAILGTFALLPGAVGDSWEEAQQTFRATTSQWTHSMHESAASIENSTRLAFANVEQFGENVNAVYRTMPAVFEETNASVQKFFADAQKAALAGVPGVDKWISQVRLAIKTANEAGQALAIAQAKNEGEIPFISQPMGSSVDTSNLKMPEDASSRMLKWIRELMHLVPGLTDDFVEFIAKLNEADGNRLQGIVGFMNQQAGLLRTILEQRRDLLAIDIEIERTNMRLAALALEQQRIQLQQQQAMLPFEQQLLGLERQRLQVELAMLPIQNQIADIDKQIALLSQENLSLRMRELQIRQQMLPIENQIAEVDKRIAATQQRRFDLEIAAAKIQEQMLPVQFQIEDIQKQIAANNQENYALTRRRLQLQQQEIPHRRAIVNIEREISALQTKDFYSEEQTLRLQLQMLGPKQEQQRIEEQLRALGTANYSLELARAQVAAQELPIRQKIADIEREINAIIDQRQALQAKREQLLAEGSVATINKQLTAVDKQLEDLWARFGTGRGASAASLIPQIIGLEKQKTQLQESLKPAQELVDKLREQQTEIERTNELQKIELELRKLAYTEALEPINQQVQALEAQAEAQRIANEVVRVGLEQQKAAIEAILKPLESQLSTLERQKETAELLRSIQINSLERQKTLLEQVLTPIERQIQLLEEQAEVTEIAAAISNTYLQEQLQAQEKILSQYESQLTAVQRQQQAFAIRNEIVRLGLEQERSRLEAILQTWQNQIDTVERERRAEELRNQIAITGLEQQKQRLEALLLPLQNAKEAIERQTAAITLQQQLTSIAYQEQLLKLQAIELANSLYKNNLETLRAAEQERLRQLIEKFQAAVTQSGVFSSEEAKEVTKRLGLWQGEVSKLSELESQYKDIIAEVGNTSLKFGGPGGLNANVSTSTTNFGALYNKLLEMNNATGPLRGLGNYLNTGFNGYIGEASNKSVDMGDALVTMRNALAGNPTLEALFTGLSNAFNAANGFWNDQITRTSNLATQFGNLRDMINEASTAHTNFSAGVAKSIATQAAASAFAAETFKMYLAAGYDWESAAKGTYTQTKSLIDRKVIGFAEGGMVPGPIGKPMMAMVHGGEYVIPAKLMQTPTAADAATTAMSNTVINNFNFSANYERQQDPITAAMDMRSLIAMTR